MINYQRIRAILIYICTIAITFHIFWGRHMNSLYHPLFYTCILTLLVCILILGFVNLRNITRKKQAVPCISIGKQSRLKSFLAPKPQWIFMLAFIPFSLNMIHIPLVPDYFIYIFWVLLGIAIGYKIGTYCNAYTQKYLSDTEKETQ